MSHLSPAECLLKSLGISEPREINVEAIAYDQGAVVRYRLLNGCEARIVGHGDRAIISVDDQVTGPRRRFSVAHELGHWHHHRGQSFLCRSEDIGNPHYDPLNPERLADMYAADLLLPSYLFVPRAESLSAITFENIKALSKEFSTSVTATALRMVEYGPESAMLVCHNWRGRKWFYRPAHIPRRWFPQDKLDPASDAYSLLNGEAGISRQVRINARAWFEAPNAEHYDLFEQNFRIAEGEVLTVLIFENYEMLDGAASRCRRVVV